MGGGGKHTLKSKIVDSWSQKKQKENIIYLVLTILSSHILQVE